MQLDQPLMQRVYKMPDSEQEIILTKDVLETFETYSQKRMEPEAGGLLFAEFKLPKIYIVKASPPNSKDGRWRTLFIPNRILQKRLIRNYFKQGWHLVGEWHTHPQNNPNPSSTDLHSMADSFLKSRHELNYFIMAIAGNSGKNPQLWISIHDGKNVCRLNELSR